MPNFLQFKKWFKLQIYLTFNVEQGNRKEKNGIILAYRSFLKLHTRNLLHHRALLFALKNKRNKWEMPNLNSHTYISRVTKYSWKRQTLQLICSGPTR